MGYLLSVLKFEFHCLKPGIMNRNIIIVSCIQKARRTNAINISEMENLITKIEQAEKVEPINIPDDIVTMNSIVELKFMDTEKAIICQIVYPDREDYEKNKFSIFSPLSSAILGHRVSDEIEFDQPSGITKIRIEKILYQPETVGDFPL